MDNKVSWIKEIDWDKLKNPDPLFKLFTPTSAEPTDPFYLKVSKLQRLLMKRPLWLSDEYRTARGIDSIINYYFAGSTFSVFYEYGDFETLVGFMDIHPGFKCEMTFKLIKQDAFGADFLRAAKELVELYIRQFRLRRVFGDTMDERIVRIAKMIGFTFEGERPNFYRWNDKFYPKYILGKCGD